MQLEGKKEFFVKGQSRRTCSVTMVCLRLAVLSGFQSRFWPKKAVFAPKLRRFGRTPPDLAPPPRGANIEFLAENLDLARAPPRLWDG